MSEQQVIDVPDVPQPTAVLCWQQKLTPPGAMTRCDRKAGHKGPHSWEPKRDA